ncbi:MAG: 50S ribosomal protein L9 [Syntrophobacterales bacterium]|jgi:large subunit ribosomal protein L9|nr:50S ribosomal protein L9 [Syntrophobacterales bacterium]
MKVILIEDLKGTGKKGEIVDVRDGYGRNFLIPKGLALPAVEGNVARLDHIVKSAANKKIRELKTAEEIKARLEEITVHVKKKVGVDGKLFGSVTHKDIAVEIGSILSVPVDRKQIRMDEVIKMTGAYTVEIHLGQGVNAEVKIEVEAQE